MARSTASRRSPYNLRSSLRRNDAGETSDSSGGRLDASSSSEGNSLFTSSADASDTTPSNCSSLAHNDQADAKVGAEPMQSTSLDGKSKRVETSSRDERDSRDEDIDGGDSAGKNNGSHAASESQEDDSEAGSDDDEDNDSSAGGEQESGSEEGVNDYADCAQSSVSGESGDGSGSQGDGEEDEGESDSDEENDSDERSESTEAGSDEDEPGEDAESEYEPTQIPSSYLPNIKKSTVPAQLATPPPLTSSNNFISLPDEVLEMIFLLLSPCEFVSLMRTCQRFTQLVESRDCALWAKTLTPSVVEDCPDIEVLLVNIVTGVDVVPSLIQIFGTRHVTACQKCNKFCGQKEEYRASGFDFCLTCTQRTDYKLARDGYFNRQERKEILVRALGEEQLELRGDSALCEQFISGGNGWVPSIVKTM